MTKRDIEEFEDFTEPLIGLPVSHVWQGYGSALFFEFGQLTPRVRRDGSQGNPSGEMSLFIQEGWRIEGKRRIWCGSWSEKERLAKVLKPVQGLSVTSIAMFGRLGEIDLCLSNGLHILSFKTTEGDPDWSLENRQHIYLGVVAGRLQLDHRSERSSLEN
jgi:hypothetical protein